MSYVHGYESHESGRLADQARTLAELLHHDTRYPAGSRVLEAGCGVGAQTTTLARRSPLARFTAVDISRESLAEAQRLVGAERLGNVELAWADLAALPFAEDSFDHVFVCFVLEHLARPVQVLAALRRVLKPGGSLTVIEGDHGTACFHPESAAARAAIACQVELQRRAGGDALIGRRLRALLQEAGFREVRVSPRFVYADAGRPEWVEGFTRRTFNAMIEGVRAPALAAGLSTAEAFDAGLRDLARTTEVDGSFSYGFFKALAFK